MSSAMQNNKRRSSNKPHVYNRNNFGGNNYRRETPEPEQAQGSNSPVRGIYGDANTTVIMCSLLGTQTTVKTRNNSVYKGHTTGFSDKGDVAMSDVKLETQDENGAQDQDLSGIIIPKDTFVVVKSYGLDMKGLCSGHEFTDAAIASKMNGSTDSPLRELTPWEDDDGSDTITNLQLDDKAKGWEPSEMFKVNSEKYNVKSSYDDCLLEYTTKLPSTDSADYEERLKFAQRKAEEIERSETYQRHINKELDDGDEEAKFSSVHRPETSSSSSGKYTIPALRNQSSDDIRNGSHRGNPSRNLPPRQNSPYSSGQPHNHNSAHHSHPRSYGQGPPPSRGPTGDRSQRQNIPNHSSPSNSHYHHSGAAQPSRAHQMPPQSSAPPKQHQSPTTQQQPPQATTASPTQSPVVKQAPVVAKQPQNTRQQSSKDAGSNELSTDSGFSADPTPSQAYHKQPDQDNTVSSTPTVSPPQHAPPKAKHMEPVPSVSEADSAMQSSTAVSEASSALPPTASADRRPLRGSETNPEENSRNKVKQLQEFHQNFNLDSVSASDNSFGRDSDLSVDNLSTTSPSSVSLPSSISSSTSQTTNSSSDPPPKAVGEKAESEDSSKIKISKLNPMAKEFKPFAPAAPATPVEAQSPSPQSRSPHYMQPATAVPYPAYQNLMPVGAYHPALPGALLAAQPMPRKKATVSVGPVNDPLTAHQVTGQPLMATQSVIFQPLAHPQAIPQAPQAYQVINMANPPGARMVAPNTLTAMAGPVPPQHNMADPQTPQPQQPQPVFMTAQGQQVLSAIPAPAHLPPHPQPAHGQPLPHPTTSQPQPPAGPNPAPSPVQQHGGPPPQPATPQPTHFPQMGGPAMHSSMAPRHASLPAQQPPAPGAPPSSQPQQLSMGYPINLPAGPQYTYPNASVAQYSYAPAPQPQTSQQSGSGGPQPQYVVMPQPGPQAHPPMQQPGQPQAYPGPGPSGPQQLQFQQHNMMQGPPQMPPTPAHTPGQGGPHLIHSNMQGIPAGIHPQVSGTPPGMFMQVPQQFQHQQ